MKTIIAINTSPRAKWNTGQMVRAAAAGAEDAGATVEVIDLYKLEPFMGCRSCFACMTEGHYDACAFKDGLSETLAKLRDADGIIMGTPVYFGQPTAGYRALHERLCFQHLTYQIEGFSSNKHPVPVLFITTSNCPAEEFEPSGFATALAGIVGNLEMWVGPTTTYSATETMQTDHYERYTWTFFDAEARTKRHEDVFPQDLQNVRDIAAKLFA